MITNKVWAGEIENTSGALEKQHRLTITYAWAKNSNLLFFVPDEFERVFVKIWRKWNNALGNAKQTILQISILRGNNGGNLKGWHTCLWNIMTLNLDSCNAKDKWRLNRFCWTEYYQHSGRIGQSNGYCLAMLENCQLWKNFVAETLNVDFHLFEIWMLHNF